MASSSISRPSARRRASGRRPTQARRRAAALGGPASPPFLLALTAALSACGGSYRGAAGPSSPDTGNPGEAARGVEAAALPYTIVDARTGRQVDSEAFWSRLATTRVVCVGEEHPNPHHHWAQLEVVTRLTPRGPYPTLALAMEMFQRPFQGVLDDFAAARIDERALLSRSGWAERWGYDFAMYRPIVQRMVGAGGHLVALNPAKELVKRVSRGGLDSLSANERAALPELKLDDTAHRAWFDGVMAEMGGGAAHGGNPHRAAPSGAPEAAEGDAPEGHGDAPAGHGGAAMPSADRIYTVQVLWDESMADGAARWVQTSPAHRAVVLAGNGHCHDTAVVARIKRRGVAEVVSVRPVVDTGGDEVASALAKPMNDYLFVMTMPQRAAAR